MACQGLKWYGGIQPPVSKSITHLPSQCWQKPWSHGCEDGIEAPAAHFSQSGKYQHQLLKVGQNKNPELWLAFAFATFHASGKFKPALYKWEAKAKVDQTFANFLVFIQKEFRKHHKHNKITDKLAGFGIASSITNKDIEKIEQLKAQALILLADGSLINQWDKLLPQTILTLNLLCQSNLDLRICLPPWQFWLQSDANCTHGLCCTVSHKTKLTKDVWWAFGRWYLFENVCGALQDTCCFFAKRRAKRLADREFFKHKYITQPTVTPADAIIKAF